MARTASPPPSWVPLNTEGDTSEGEDEEEEEEEEEEIEPPRPRLTNNPSYKRYRENLASDLGRSPKRLRQEAGPDASRSSFGASPSKINV